MATISRKTLAITIECLMHWTQPKIEHFLFELDVPEDIAKGPSKRSMLLNLFKGLEKKAQEQESDDSLQEFLLEVIPRLGYEDQKLLKSALIRDGFVFDKGEIAKDVPVAQENRTSLELLLNRHSTDLTTITLTHHLKENIDLFRQERWDSSISHARNFVEQLLKDVAQKIAIEKKENPNLSKPVLVRQYLQKTGFFDDAEKNKLVDGIYGYFSEEGSHPGISNQSTARVCMHIFWAFAYYVLEKFDEWKGDST